MKRNLLLFYSFCLLFTSSALMAADGDGDGPEVPGDPVPINDYIPLLIIAGLCLAFYLIYKRRQANHSSAL